MNTKLPTSTYVLIDDYVIMITYLVITRYDITQLILSSTIWCRIIHFCMTIIMFCTHLQYITGLVAFVSIISYSFLAN